MYIVPTAMKIEDRKASKWSIDSMSCSILYDGLPRKYLYNASGKLNCKLLNNSLALPLNVMTSGAILYITFIQMLFMNVSVYSLTGNLTHLSKPQYSIQLKSENRNWNARYPAVNKISPSLITGLSHQRRNIRVSLSFIISIFHSEYFLEYKRQENVKEEREHTTVTTIE